ncbi:hypothetical protein KP509_09G078200 [Ceratopteris richardii]|uniref:Auxin-responsive protein n=1 Tax=Ceratopteris richardii TaxID=49495 RepID=A0A8T2U8C7_CERRI|nr:hypothetical protein KP509_09G078200 [Ceratopteris richardii]
MHWRRDEVGKCFLDVAADPRLRTEAYNAGNCSSEASAPSYTQSTSSTIVSPVHLDPSDAPYESSAQSDSNSFKEQDYMGVSDTSSTACKMLSERKELQCAVKVDVEEPDLLLGLGPSSVKGSVEKVDLNFFSQTNIAISRKLSCPLNTRVDGQEPVKIAFDVEHVTPRLSCEDPMPLKRLDSVSISNFSCSLPIDPNTKCPKRLFSEMRPPSEGAPVAYANAAVNINETNAGTSFAPNNLRMIIQQPDTALKAINKQFQVPYWGTSPRTSPWQPEFAHGSSPFGQLPCNKSSGIPLGVMKITENLGSLPAEVPPAKEQVVGWPPVRSYRRSAINSRISGPTKAEADVQGATFVKVTMDGFYVGRKVDLNAYRNYEELLSALEGMFSPVGEGAKFLHARDFVLTYQDKEGDWMLVGDVPWGMFVRTVKRLRITRNSDSTCLGSSASKNLS